MTLANFMLSLDIKVSISNDPACAKMSTMEREMDVFSDLSRLRSEAEERRSALEEMREELGARRVAVAQNLNEAQDRHDKAKVGTFDTERQHHTFLNLAGLPNHSKGPRTVKTPPR